jgi:hypothetical protein
MNEDWTLLKVTGFHSDEKMPPGPSGNCAKCDLPLGERPPAGFPALDHYDGTLLGASWWWDFDPRTELRYCAMHYTDTSEPEAFKILRGDL